MKLLSSLKYEPLERVIERHECLSQVCKRLKINLSNALDKILKSSRSDKSYEKKILESEKQLSSKEITSKLKTKYKGTLVKDSTSRQSWGDNNSKEIKTLSVGMCAQIATYYILAVQRNKGDIAQIIRAIQAIHYHLGANDENAKRIPSTVQIILNLGVLKRQQYILESCFLLIQIFLARSVLI